MPNPKGNPSSLRNGGGRPRGVPNKNTQAVRKFAREVLEDPQAQRKTVELYRRGRLHPAIVTTLMHYAYGKPKDTIEHEGVSVIPVLRVVIDDDAGD